MEIKLIKPNRKNVIISKSNQNLNQSKSINNIRHTRKISITQIQINNKDKNILENKIESLTKDKINLTSSLNSNENKDANLENDYVKTIFLNINDPFITTHLKTPPIFLYTNYSSAKLKIAEEKCLPVTFIEKDTRLEENKSYKCYLKTYKQCPPCLDQTFLNSSCKKVKSSKLANVTWKLYKDNKMRKFIPTLASHQRYNHFPKLFQLGRKDYLWRNFCRFKNKFPDDYNYLPRTFILPEDAKKFKSNKANFNQIWIFKPVASSRGRGIRVLEKEELKLIIDKSELKTTSDYLISKYIEKPHLINGKKYDLRIYVLITSFAPLKIYLYRQGLVRFATEEYSQSNKENIFIHLTNYSVNKANVEKGKLEDGDEDRNQLKWTLSMYESYFIENNLRDEYNNIFVKIKDIIIKSILSITEDSYLHAKLTTKNRNSLFELYGYDILIDEAYNPWLLEVNVSPSLNCDTELDLKLKSDLIGDIVNVIGIVPAGLIPEKGIIPIKNYKLTKIKIGHIPNKKSTDTNSKQTLSKLKKKLCKEYDYNELSKNPIHIDNEQKYLWSKYKNELVAEYQAEFIRSQFGLFNQIFPMDRTVLINYLKYLKQPGDENIILWSWLLNANYDN